MFFTKPRREAKRNPQRKKQKKDPGIPNDYPFKEELLMAAVQLKEQVNLLSMSIFFLFAIASYGPLIP
jgi:hypothetical protein